MSEAPAWIQILQGLLTPAIAAGVGTIGFLQWRTAHQKVNLDLFDRRMTIYEGVINRIRAYFEDYDEDNYIRADDGLAALEGKARFLFGPEVANLIAEFRTDILLHAKAYRQICRKDLIKQEKDEADAAFEMITARLRPYEKLMTSIVSPYVRMDSKVIGTPVEWIAQRNQIRLSYADEKQR